MNASHAPVSALDRVEQRFNAVAAMLAAGDTDHVVQASAALQSVIVELAGLAAPGQGLPLKSKADIDRMKALARGISLLRQNVLRRAAHVDQALAIVVPTSAASTYAGGGNPFSTMARQTGQFRVVAA